MKKYKPLDLAKFYDPDHAYHINRRLFGSRWFVGKGSGARNSWVRDIYFDLFEDKEDRMGGARCRA